MATYLFDFDGTLVDSMPTSAGYEQEMREICDGYIRDFEELPALFI